MYDLVQHGYANDQICARPTTDVFPSVSAMLSADPVSVASWKAVNIRDAVFLTCWLTV